MTGRADILAALLARLQTAAVFQTAGLRLVFWNSVDALPALFIRHVADEYGERRVRGLPRPPMTMSVQLWIYARQEDVAAPTSDVMEPLLDAVDAALAPAGANAVQDLGLRGVVSHCWIEGRAAYDDGAVQDDGYVKCMIPVKILVEWLAP